MRCSQTPKSRLRAKKQVITIKDEVDDEPAKESSKARQAVNIKEEIVRDLPPTHSEAEPAAAESAFPEVVEVKENHFQLACQAVREADLRAERFERTLQAARREYEKRTEELEKRVEELSAELGQYKQGGMQLMQKLQLQQLPLQADLNSILSAVQRLQAKNEECREAASMAEKHRQTADDLYRKLVECQSLLMASSQNYSMLQEKYEQAARVVEVVHAASSIFATRPQQPAFLHPAHSLTPPASVASGRIGETDQVASSILATRPQQPAPLHPVHALTPPESVESGRIGETEKAPSQPLGVQGNLGRVKTEEGDAARGKEEKEKRAEQTREETAQAASLTRPQQPVSLQSTHSLAPSDRRESVRNGESAVSSPVVQAPPSEHPKRSYREILRDMKKENGGSEKEKEKSAEPTRAASSTLPKRTFLEVLNNMKSEEGTRKRLRREEEEEKKEKEAKKKGASGEKRVKFEMMEEAEQEIRVKQKK